MPVLPVGGGFLLFFFLCLGLLPFTVAFVLGFLPFAGREFLVDLFQERREIVQRFQIEASVYRSRTLVVDGIAVRSSVFQFHAAFPGIVGRVIAVEGHPRETRYFFERYFVRGREVLLVVERSAESLDAVPYGIFPHLVLVRIEVLVDRNVRFFDFRMGGGVEREVKVFGQVPLQTEIAVPQKLFGEGERERRRVFQILDVPFLVLVIVAQDVRVEADVLRQVVEVLVADDVPPFALAFNHLLERLERLVFGRIVVVERSVPVFFRFPSRGFARLVGLAVRIAEREVGGVVWHGVFGRGDVELHVAQAEVLIRGLCGGQASQRVFFVLRGASVESVFQQHVRVERIIFRFDDLFVERIVNGRREAYFLRQQLAQFEAGRDAVIVHVFLVAFAHFVFYASESGCFHVSGQIDGTQVGELYIQGTLCGPTAIIAVFLQAKLVGPYFHRLGCTGIVTHADHDGLHLAQGRVTHDAYLVVRPVVVVDGEECGQVGIAEALLAVACLFHFGEHREVDVQHILFRPYGAALFGGISVVASGCRQLQGNFVFVEVVLVVRAEPDEDTGLIVFRFGYILGQRVGMDEHLEVFVLAHVQVGVLVHGAGVSRSQVTYRQREGLFVVFGQLALCRIHYAADARRQYVVHRCLVVVFFDVDSRYFHASVRGGHFAGIKSLFVGTPFGFHQIQCGETKDDGLFETGQEHTHEPYAREIVDVAHFLLVFGKRYAELIPIHLFRVAVAELDACRTFVHDMVLPHNEVFRTDADFILVIFLVLVQCVVLIDVFHVGCGLV